MGSMVLPQRYAEKSLPGISSTRVASPSRAIAAIVSFQYAGTSSGRSTLWDRNPLAATGANAAAARIPTTTVGHTCPNQRAATGSPAAISPAIPSTSNGTARGVLRSASPAEEPANDLKNLPYALGSS